MGSEIEWSVPVSVDAGDDGALCVVLPDKAARGLGVEAGDVLCFTGFANGTVEIWSVKKSPYSALDDVGAADKAMERVRQSGEKEP